MDHSTRDYGRDREMAGAAAQQTQGVEKAIRADRAIAHVLERLRKLDAVFSNAVGRAAELRSRLLGDREPANLNEARDRGLDTPKAPPPQSELDELRRALGELEETSAALHRQLEGLERL